MTITAGSEPTPSDAGCPTNTVPPPLPPALPAVNRSGIACGSEGFRLWHTGPEPTPEMYRAAYALIYDKGIAYADELRDFMRETEGK